MTSTRPTRMRGVAYEIRGRANAEAARLEAAGHPVLRLNVGNPAQFGFRAAPAVLAEVAGTLDAAQGYSEARGLPAARAAVAEDARGRGVPVAGPEDVHLGNGVSELILMAAQALLDDGDEVLVPAPDYPLWTAAVRLVGARAVHYPCDEQAGWLPDVAALRRRITPRTTALVIINPNNPTGAVYPTAVLAELLEVAREHGLTVLSDEIYDRIVYDGVHVPTAALAPDVPCLTFNGLSKASLLAGFRSGWMMLTGPARSAPGLRDGLDTLAGMRLSPNLPGQHAVAVALAARTAEPLVLPGGRLREQRDAVHAALTALPGVSCVRPAGALYAFPRLDPAHWAVPDDEQLVLDLLREEHVLLAHGTGFNWTCPDHLRIVTLPAATELVDAVGRLGAFLDRSGRRLGPRAPVARRSPVRAPLTATPEQDAAPVR